LDCIDILNVKIKIPNEINNINSPTKGEDSFIDLGVTSPTLQLILSKKFLLQYSCSAAKKTPTIVINITKQRLICPA
jgi:hypothetical protein